MYLPMKADLNLHSRFSDRSADWLFRRFDFPDSYSQPRALYDLLRERGMDLVTLTDHNTLDGVLEIAALPGVFLSEEVTTYFPEDRCKVHVLVWGLTEAQHREIATCGKTSSTCKGTSPGKNWRTPSRTRSTSSTTS